MATVRENARRAAVMIGCPSSLYGRWARAEQVVLSTFGGQRLSWPGPVPQTGSWASQSRRRSHRGCGAGSGRQFGRQHIDRLDVGG